MTIAANATIVRAERLGALTSLIGVGRDYVYHHYNALEDDAEQHSWQSYVILIPQKIRKVIMEKLADFGIETRPGTHAVHTLSFYRNKYNLSPGTFPNVLHASKSSIALPLHNHMSLDDVKFVSSKLLEFLNATR